MAASAGMRDMTRNAIMRNVRGVHRLVWLGSVAAMIGAAAGCGSDSPVETQPDDAVQFWRVMMTQRAVTMAVNQTLQLTATAQNGAGSVLTGLPMPTFQSTNTSAVTVDTHGVLHALATTTTAMVIASLTVDGITAADTIPVVVTTASHAFKSLSLPPADSTKISISGGASATARPVDSADAPLSGLSIRYWVSDPYIATIGTTGSLAGVARGTVWAYASTTSYGVTSTDSVEYMVTNPLTATMYFYGSTYASFYPLGFYPTTPVVIAAGGSVTVWNYSGATGSLTFGADSLKVTGGNLTSFGSFASATRTFPTLGQYTLTDGSGLSASIYVVAP